MQCLLHWEKARLFIIDASLRAASDVVAVPCALIGCIMNLSMEYEFVDFSGKDAPLAEQTVWSGFSFLVGFLVVFRTMGWREEEE